MTDKRRGGWTFQRKMRTLRERFDEKWMAEPNSGCWLWTGQIITRLGRGIMTTGRRGKGHSPKDYAYRIAWALHVGPIPDGAFVCHHCDNPACVNPQHLFLGDHDENMADMRRKGRSLRGTRNHNAKLTEDDVIAIRSILRGNVVEKRALAKQFGVSEMIIGMISRREIWSHV